MSMSLPTFHFRMRDNGVQVYRVVPSTRDRRMELEPVAILGLGRQEIRPRDGVEFTPAEEAELRAWMADRVALDATRRFDDVGRLTDQIGRTAQWAQSHATDAELEAVTDQLLLAMHDLRTVLVRKRAARLSAEEE